MPRLVWATQAPLIVENFERDEVEALDISEGVAAFRSSEMPI